MTHLPPSSSKLGSFDALFTEYQRHVLAYALRRTQTPDDAEDAAAEVFSIAWRKWDSIPVSEPLPWLYAVARRVLANQRRGDGRRARLAGLIRQDQDVATPLRLGEDVDGPAFRALASLSPADQEILRLVAWEELRSQAIADVLGITPNAAAIRLHRARARFAAALDRDDSSTNEPDLKDLAATRTSGEVKGDAAWKGVTR